STIIKQNCNTILIDSCRIKLYNLQEKIKKETGKGCKVILCNLENDEEVDKIIEKIEIEYNKIDILVNNLHVCDNENDLFHTRSVNNDWTQFISKNYNQIIRFTRKTAQVMKNNNYGRII